MWKFINYIQSRHFQEGGADQGGNASSLFEEFFCSPSLIRQALCFIAGGPEGQYDR